MQIFYNGGVYTARAQARDDLIIREGATEKAAESWAAHLERAGELDSHGYAPYTRLIWSSDRLPRATWRYIQQARGAQA